MSRRDDAIMLARAVGASSIELLDAQNGWPALARVHTMPEPTLVSLHVGPIGSSHRKRDAVERRFQNPGQNRPIKVLPGTIPLLIGIWEQSGQIILVGMNAASRVGDITRVSLFVPLAALITAPSAGWVEHFSDTGEKIVAFRPELLPIYVQMIRSGVSIEERDVRTILSAAGATTNEDAGERARRTASQLIRDAAFSRDICRAYGGLCAMCGLNHSLVVGAHIYPVAAPNSKDKAWNGLALCQNHHAAFDSHRIFVHPTSREIRLHPSFRAEMSKNEASKAFVRLTFDRLVDPSNKGDRPTNEVFEDRYLFFVPKYDWSK